MSAGANGNKLARIGLSESDLERIATFAATPRYARDPEMLLPDDRDRAAE